MSLYGQIIERFVTPDLLDLLFESLVLLLFIILLITLVVLRKKYAMLQGTHGRTMIWATVCGIIGSAMNVFDEIVWFTQEAYFVWKFTKGILMALAFLLLAFAFIQLIGFFERITTES